MGEQIDFDGYITGANTASFRKQNRQNAKLFTEYEGG